MATPMTVRPPETTLETEHVPQTAKPDAAHIVKTDPGESAAAGADDDPEEAPTLANTDNSRTESR